MKGDIVYIMGRQMDEPGRGDTITVECGLPHTWGHNIYVVSVYDCRYEKQMRDKYAEKGLSAYSTDELLDELRRRINDNSKNQVNAIV